MARIRTVKPEFWTDGKVRRLSDSTALFFIALWNFSDDYGYFTLDSLELSMKVCRWRSQDMMKMCSALERAGLIRCSRGDGVGMIIGWEHQKIKDRHASMWNEKEINWDEIQNDAPKSVKKSLGKDRIGKDRIGKDKGSDGDLQINQKAQMSLDNSHPADDAPLENIVAIYCDAWKSRYKANPIIQGKDAGRLNKFSKSVGIEKAKKLICAYLDMPDQWFITKRHDVDTMLGNLNAIALFMESGRVISKKEIQNLDSSLRFNNLIKDIEENGI